MNVRPNPRDATLDRLAARALEEEALMPRAGTPLVVAVSGGPDSMALLHFLVARSRAEGTRTPVIAAHVNHGLRGVASEEDAAFVKSQAEAWGAAAEIAHADLPARARERAAGGAAVEAEARRARYRALREIASRAGADRIFAAHTADDQAETVLLRLVRGAGLHGLGGMAPLARVHGVRVARPFLGVTRDLVLDYAARHGIPYREDSTNRATAASRNYVRHEVLPRIETRLNPAARDALLRAAGAIREADAYLARKGARAYRRLLLERSGEKIILDAPRLLLYPNLLRTYVFRRAVRELSGNLRDIAAVHLRALHQLALSQRGHAADLPGKLQALRDRDHVILIRKRPRRPESARSKAPSKA